MMSNHSFDWTKPIDWSQVPTEATGLGKQDDGEDQEEERKPLLPFDWTKEIPMKRT